jgi:SAM-dependent methyltransferase
MKRRLVDLLACPACHADLTLHADAVDGAEIVTGRLTCQGCDASFPIAGGIPRFTETHSRGHDATARAFGFQWKRYSDLDERYRTQFLDWLRPVQPEFFAGRTILEGGCGKGRHTALAAEFGARDVVAIDLSEAAEVAYANTGHHPAVHIVQADLNHPPVKPVFDYAFSIGVLHHLPEPERGFRALVSRLRPGGYMSAWVYGREGNGWIVHFVSPFREKVTARLPHHLLRPIANLATLPLFLASRLLYKPTAGTAAGQLLPYGDYIRYIAPFPFREQRTIVFDHLVAPVAFYIPHDDFAGWFARCGMVDVRIEHHNANSWRGFARVPTAG